MSVEMSMTGLSAGGAAVVGSLVVDADASLVYQKVGIDCPEHAAMQAAGDAVADNTSHCSTCVACQICHTVALTGITPLELAPFGAFPPVAHGGTWFASAALPNGFKPPIS